MSLLNQVLQDLEDRAPAERKQPVHLAVATPANGARDRAHGDARVERRRLWAGMAAILLFVVAVWAFYPAGTPSRTGHVAPVPPPVATDANPVNTETPGQLIGSAPTGQAAPGPLSAPAGGTVSAAAEPATADVGEPAAASQALSDTAKPVEPAPDIVEKPAPRPGEPVIEPESPQDPVDYLPLHNTEPPPAAVPPGIGVDAGMPVSLAVKTAVPEPVRPLDQVRREVELGELSYAEYLLHEHLRTVPGEREARELLIGLMLRGERHAAALKQLELGLAQDPDHAKFSLIKARLLAQAGDVAAALEALEAIPADGDTAVEQLQMLGALYQQASRYKQAEASYRQLLQLNPKSSAAWAGLALSLDARGEPDAREAYARALQLGGLPPAADAYARRRLAELESGRG